MGINFGLLLQDNPTFENFRPDICRGDFILSPGSSTCGHAVDLETIHAGQSLEVFQL
jgi:hypothetical protein